MAAVTPGLEPFLFQRGRVGCLLIHGFMGTPWEMLELGQYLADRQVTALGIRLEGHATRVQDLAHTDWHDWWESARAGLWEIRGLCDQVFVVGQSMGGDLALHLAAHYPVDAVAALGAPIRLQNPLVRLVRPAKYLVPYVNSTEDIHDPVAKARQPSYRQIPLRSLESLTDLLRHLDDDLGEVRVPALVIQSRLDRLVPPSNALYIFDHISSADKRLVWLEHGGHVVTVDYDKSIVFDEIHHFIAQHALL